MAEIHDLTDNELFDRLIKTTDQYLKLLHDERGWQEVRKIASEVTSIITEIRKRQELKSNKRI